MSFVRRLLRRPLYLFAHPSAACQQFWPVWIQHFLLLDIPLYTIRLCCFWLQQVIYRISVIISMISFIWVWYCCCCVICAWCSIDERAPALASFNTQRVYQQYFILCTYNDSFTGFIIILCLILSILLSLHSLYSCFYISVHKQRRTA